MPRRSLAIGSVVAIVLAVAVAAWLVTTSRVPVVHSTAPRASVVDPIEKNELLATVRREQAALRDELARAIDDAERKLGAETDAQTARTLGARRDALEAELDALEATPDEGWDALKTRIENTLAAQRG